MILFLKIFSTNYLLVLLWRLGSRKEAVLTTGVLVVDVIVVETLFLLVFDVFEVGGVVEVTEDGTTFIVEFLLRLNKERSFLSNVEVKLAKTWKKKWFSILFINITNE